MKKTVRINASLLPPALKARFDALLEVAGKRSIVAWQRSDDPLATDVLVRQRMAPEDERTVPIYVCDTLPHHTDFSMLYLPTDFRVNHLMDTLDLAAVRVMNRWDSMARVHPSPQGGDPAQQYQLRHWVFLDAAHTGMNYTRTLAAMTQRPVTRQWMTTQGGLSEPQADSLLAELQLRGALQSSTRPAPLAMSAQAPMPKGFVNRLRRWLAGSRAQTMGSAP